MPERVTSADDPGEGGAVEPRLSLEPSSLVTFGGAVSDSPSALVDAATDVMLSSEPSVDGDAWELPEVAGMEVGVARELEGASLDEEPPEVSLDE